MAQLVNIPTFIDKRGSLTVIEKLTEFKIKRVYYIYNVSNFERGGHRHKTTKQLLICLRGSCSVYVNNGKEKSDFILSKPNVGLLLQAEDWHTMKDFQDDPILLVLASTSYNPDEYIDEEYE